MFVEDRGLTVAFPFSHGSPLRPYIYARRSVLHVLFLKLTEKLCQYASGHGSVKGESSVVNESHDLVRRGTHSFTDDGRSRRVNRLSSPTLLLISVKVPHPRVVTEDLSLGLGSDPRPHPRFPCLPSVLPRGTL